MKKQLLSWAPNLTFGNKWDRMAFSKQGTFVAAWVFQQDETFNSRILNTGGEGEPIIAKDGFKSLDDATAFADVELKKQGYSF